MKFFAAVMCVPVLMALASLESIGPTQGLWTALVTIIYLIAMYVPPLLLIDETWTTWRARTALWIGTLLQIVWLTQLIPLAWELIPEPNVFRFIIVVLMPLGLLMLTPWQSVISMGILTVMGVMFSLGIFSITVAFAIRNLDTLVTQSESLSVLPPEATTLIIGAVAVNMLLIGLLYVIPIRRKLGG